MKFFYIKGLDPIAVRLYLGDGVKAPEREVVVTRIRDSRDRWSINNPSLTDIENEIRVLSEGYIKEGSLQGVLKQIECYL